MAYMPSTDFVGLWRSSAGGVAKGEMPGLDFVVAALSRAGILNVVAAGSPPTVNQDTTAWFQPSSSSYSGEGLLYLWNGSSYVLATPQLFSDLIITLAGGLPTTPSLPSSTTTVGVNYIINGGFRVNQVAYVSGAVLAAGAYGHDQWKAGASGGDYSFTQLKSNTQIVIASGKSLIQPIEDVNVVGGSYVLSWTGTAQARAGINTLTPSGSYAASPLLITGQSAGTVMSVEFNNGSLGTVKLEQGTTATPFVMQLFTNELTACRRYYQKLGGESGAVEVQMQGYALAGQAVGSTIVLSPPMRAAPVVTQAGTWSTLNVASTAFFPSATAVGWRVLATATGLVGPYNAVGPPIGYLALDARL